MKKPARISTDLMIDIHADALCRHVGRTHAMSVPDLSDLTGLDERTINSYRNREHAPSLMRALQIAMHLPADYINDLILIAGLGGATSVDKVPVDAPEITANLAQVVSELTHRLRDGRFCHQDKAAMAPALRELSRLCAEQAAAMDHGRYQGLQSVANE
jgi:hypothetical protein